MEHYALVIRHADMALIDPPAIICRSWHPTEDPDLDGDELELEIDLHERGWRMCRAYSRYEPDGEFGHITGTRLLAIPQLDFQEALQLLQDQDLPEYEECVYNTVVRVDARSTRCGGSALGADGCECSNVGFRCGRDARRTR